MKKLIFIFLTLFLIACNEVEEHRYEVKFKDGSVTYVNGYDVFCSRRQGAIEVWSIDGDQVFNYDEVLYVIKTK